MISITVSKMDLAELIFVIHGMEVNGQYYRDVLLSQQMLPAIKHAASDTSSTRQRSISSCKDTIKQLQQETPDFTGPDFWPPNSPDPHLVDYNVWGVMQQRVYECRMNSGDELKLRLIDVWNSLQQNVIDAAINDYRKQLRACVHADGQHFEYLLQARATNKSDGQINYK